MIYSVGKLDTALMLYILILFVLCIFYRFFLFKRLGERRFAISVCLFGVGAVVMGVCWWQELYLVFFMGLLLSICMAACCINDAEGWIQMRKRKKLATLPARKLKSCSIPFALTRDELLTNFRELAEKDELACYKPADHFMSWNDGEGHIIQVHLLPDSVDWVGIFYTPSVGELRDSEIKQACRKANIPCTSALLGMAPQGVAICQNGELTIIPASQKQQFATFRDTILSSRDAFATWLGEYTEED